jgi:hypothetical protein
MFAMDSNFFEPLDTTWRQNMQRRETAQESFNIRESRDFTCRIMEPVLIQLLCNYLD